MDVQVIVDHCSADDMIDQMIEEAGELIQACVKLKRAYRGTTPVSVMEARQKFVEEMADVAVAQSVLMYGIMQPDELETMLKTESAKFQRWQNRLTNKEGNNVH